jgi:hypothetical protein
MDDDDRVNHERALSSLNDVLRGLPEWGRSTKWASSQCPYLHQRPILFKANSSIVAILEIIRGAQCLIEVIRSSG